MSDPDRLAEFKAGLTLAQIKGHLAELDDPGTRPNHPTPRAARAYIDWLVGEVDRRGDLLTRLVLRGPRYCLICGGYDHRPGCELAAALHPGNAEAAATPKDAP